MKINVNNITSQHRQCLYDLLRPHRRILLLLFLIADVQAYGFDYMYKDVIFKCKVINKNSKTVSISSWKKRNVEDVTVPASVIDEDNNEYSVTSLDVFESGISYSTENLIIEEGVKRIEDRCFHEFFNLKNVYLPSSLTYIGKRAFGSLRKTEAFHVPEECSDRELILKTLTHPNYKGVHYISYNKPGIDKADKPVSVSRPVTATVSHPTDANAEKGTPVIKSKNFFKVENSIEAIKGKIFDYKNKPCALLKITIAKCKPSYSSSDIPEPILNYINYNVKGKDNVWMVDGATSIDVYSNSKEFEPVTLSFKEVSKGKIPSLESGCVYELQLRLEYER